MHQAIIAAIFVALISASASAGERCAEIPPGPQTDRVIEACQIKRVELGIEPAQWNARRCTSAMIRHSTRETLSGDWSTSSQAALRLLRAELRTEVPPVASCGDGTIDAAEGETCDDGNVANGDGCSEVCLIE